LRTGAAFGAGVAMDCKERILSLHLRFLLLWCGEEAAPEKYVSQKVEWPSLMSLCTLVLFRPENLVRPTFFWSDRLFLVRPTGHTRDPEKVSSL